MARTMQSYGEPPNVILAILQGDHGAVLETLYTKLGGGSGAALPSTMVRYQTPFRRETIESRVTNSDHL